MAGFFIAVGEKHRIFSNRVSSDMQDSVIRGIGEPDLKFNKTNSSMVEWTINNENSLPDLVYDINDEDVFDIYLSGYLTEPFPVSRNKYDRASFLSISRLLCSNSDNHMNSLNGSFALLAIDRINKSIRIISDRWASRSIWRHYSENTWIFASHPVLLWHAIGKPINISSSALTSLMLRSRPIGDRCMLDAGRRNTPGSIHLLQPDGKETVTKWFVPEYRTESGVSTPEWGDRLAFVLKAASSRLNRVMDDPLLFLSGGLDSRLAVAVLTSTFKNTKAVTLSQGNNLATKIACKVAKTVDISHKIVIQDKDWYLRVMEQTALLQGGNYHSSHSHFSEGLRIKEMFSQYDGVLLGDFLECFKKLLGNNVSILGHHPKPEKVCDNIFNLDGQYGVSNLEETLSLFVPSIREKLYDSWRNELILIIRDALNVSDDIFLAVDFLLRWRAAYEVATYGMLEDIRTIAPERSLSMDNAMHDLMLGIPSNVRSTGRVSHIATNILSPELSLVPNANTMLPTFVPASFHKAAKFMRPKIGAMRRHMNHIMGRKNQKTSGSWPDRRLLASTDAKWIQFISSHLKCPEAFPDSIFDKNKVEHVWERFQKGNFQLGFILDSLLTFGFIHKYYGSEKIDC